MTPSESCQDDVSEEGCQYCGHKSHTGEKCLAQVPSYLGEKWPVDCKCEAQTWEKEVGSLREQLARAQEKSKYWCVEAGAQADKTARAQARIQEAVNGVCECGGKGPGMCCLACEVWHYYKGAKNGNKNKG